MAMISGARPIGSASAIGRRDGAAEQPAGGRLPADSLQLTGQRRVEDRRSTYQVAVPPVVITAGVLGAVYGFLRTSWPIMSAGILGIATGWALKHAWDRFKAVPADQGSSRQAGR